MGYLGYTTVVFALCSAWFVREARPYILLAAVGVVLALGPFLHWAGRGYTGFRLPYGAAVSLFPFLSFGGLPSRFVWLATFGLSISAAAGAARLKVSFKHGCLLAVAMSSLAVVETWPHRLRASQMPLPPVLESIRSFPADWNVLDASSGQALWNQMHHEHPMVAGYVTRLPAKAAAQLMSEPALRQFFVGEPWGLATLRGEPQRSGKSVLEILEQWRIKALILPDARRPLAEQSGLTLISEGAGLAVYVVPGSASVVRRGE